MKQRIEPRSLPALRASLLAISGILLAEHFAITPDILLLPLVIVTIAVFVAVTFQPGEQNSWSFLLVSMLWTLLGGAKISFDDRSSRIVNLDDNEEIVIVGIVTNAQRGERIRFILHPLYSSLRGEEKTLGGDLLVSLGKNDMFSDSISVGSTLVGKGRIMPITSRRNPGEFDPRRFYAAQGILYSLQFDVDGMKVIGKAGGSWLERVLIIPARTYVGARVDDWIGGEEGELMKGLLLGDRSGLSYATRDAFARSGVAHVLAVSGAHVAIIGAFLFFGARLLRFPKWAGIVATAAGFLFFMFLTGSHPPVVRAVIMGLVLLAGMLLQRRTSALNSIGVAALIILGMDARQVFDIGFQLSFVAVVALLYITPMLNDFLSRHLQPPSIWNRILYRAGQAIGVTAIATVATLPFVANYFGQVSIIGLIANLPVIIGVTGGIYAGCLSLLSGLVIPYVGSVFAELAHLFLTATLSITKFFASSSYATLTVSWFSWFEALTLYCGTLLVVHWSSSTIRKRFFFATLLFLNLVVWTSFDGGLAKAPNVLRVNVLDVGQGDAIFVEFPGGQTMLVDAGPRLSTYDAGERVVVPFLRRKGISTLDYLVVTHPHADHLGGIASVLRDVEVKLIVECGESVPSALYKDYVVSREDEHCPVLLGRDGMIVPTIVNARAFILHAGEDGYVHSNLNNFSVVLKIQYGKTSFLLTGDAEEEVEEHLVHAYGRFLSSSVLKVGHHGSATSSTSHFMKEVKPSLAMISVGRNNKFGHPSNEVLTRFASDGIPVVRTDNDGAIIVESDGTSIRQVAWRQ
ncbi:MAG TPA: DNA internalization-related competence protein ComEC/Rec2 [Bacteroidota bacterium]